MAAAGDLGGFKQGTKEVRLRALRESLFQHINHRNQFGK